MQKRMLVHYSWCAAIAAYCGFMIYRLTNSRIAALTVTFCWILCFLLAFRLLYYSHFARNTFPFQGVLEQKETITLSGIPTTLIVPLRDIDILLQRVVVCIAIIILSLTPIGKTVIYLDRRRFFDVFNQRMLTIPGVLWLTNNRIGFLPDFKRPPFRQLTVLLSDVINCEFASDLVNVDSCLRIGTSAKKYDFQVTHDNLSSMKLMLEKIKEGIEEKEKKESKRGQRKQKGTA